jgi:hypothetical protein
MSNRTAGSHRAIAAAWEEEKIRVLAGQGTRDWSPEQQEQIKEKGKAYDAQGRAFEGQHMKSVSAYPEYQADPRNIQFLSRDEHLAAHGGNWTNPTNGYYDPASRTMSDFGDGPPHPVPEVLLTSPLYGDRLKPTTPSERPARSASGRVCSPAKASSARGSKRRHRRQSLQRSAVQAWRFVLGASKDPRVRGAVAVVAIPILKEALETASQRRSSGGGRTDSHLSQTPARANSDAIGDAPHEARQSPGEHGVSGYTRRDGTPVRPYRRGGEKD